VKRDYRKLGIGQIPHSGKPTYQDLATKAGLLGHRCLHSEGQEREAVARRLAQAILNETNFDPMGMEGFEV
jgi:hypothetical protein